MAPRAVRRFLLIALLIAFPVEARRRVVSPRTDPPPHDQFSAAELADIRTTHLALDLTIDFDARQIRGSATHTILNLAGTRRFIVDTRDMTIQSVNVDGHDATWSLGPTTTAGRPLIIDIEPGSRTVRIDYTTSPTVQGVIWLTAKQTNGGVAPFLITLSEPDNGRGWIPMQDTPGVRLTYEATIRVPPGLFALMSARNARQPTADGVYHVDMPFPIAPYLIALAVGRLEFRSLGDRVGFYAEPEWVEDASWDLQYVPEMLAVEERLLGPYPFERYDILLAPPGFSLGGMENPMLNFISVTGIVRGDHESPPGPSETVSHEMAHSWAGDLSTCATWSDTWLNEGFATYYQHRAMEEMIAPERAEIGYYFDRLNVEGYIQQTAINAHLTALHREFLGTENAWSSFSPASYNKGSIFLKTIEDRIGRANFDTFILSYFNANAWHWVDDHAFINSLMPFGDDSLKVNEWIYNTGMPSNVTAPQHSELWDRIGVEANAYRHGTPASALNTAGWRRDDLNNFLQMITDIIPQHMAELDATFHLSAMKSPSTHWFLAVALTLYPPAMPMFERFLTIGSSNVMPVYERLRRTQAGLNYAREKYKTLRERYAPNIQNYVDQVLGVTGQGVRASFRGVFYPSWRESPLERHAPLSDTDRTSRVKVLRHVETTANRSSDPLVAKGAAGIGAEYLIVALQKDRALPGEEEHRRHRAGWNEAHHHELIVGLNPAPHASRGAEG